MQSELNQGKSNNLYLCESCNHDFDGDILLWSAFVPSQNKVSVFSIPEIIEENSDSLKKSYLSFIHELGKVEINDIPVSSYLAIRPGFSFWWMTLLTEKCNYAVSSNISELMKFFGLKLWLKGKSYDNVFVTGFGSKQSNLFKDIFQEMGISCVVLDSTHRTEVPIRFVSPWSVLWHLAKAPVSLFLYIISRLPLRGVGVSKWSRSKSTTSLISYSDNIVKEKLNEGRYHSKYWESLPEVILKNEQHISFLHLFISDSLSPSAKHAAEMINKLNRTEKNSAHVTLDSFLSPALVLRAFFDWSKIVFKGWAVKNKSSRRAGLIWPLIEEDFIKSFFGISGLKSLLFFNLFEKAFSVCSIKQRGLYLQENQCWEPGLLNIWKYMGHNELIGVAHLPVQYWNLRMSFDERDFKGPLSRPMPDISVVTNKASYELLGKHGFPTKVFVGEPLRFQYLSSFCRTRVIDRHLAGEKKVLLLLGDYFPQNTRTMLDWLSLCDLQVRERFKIVIKLHPNDFNSDYSLEEFDYILSQQTIGELLKYADVAFTSNSSGSALDAFCSGVPVISALDPNKLNLSLLRQEKRVSFVYSGSDLNSAINRLDLNNQNMSLGTYFEFDHHLGRWHELLGYPL